MAVIQGTTVLEFEKVENTTLHLNEWLRRRGSSSSRTKREPIATARAFERYQGETQEMADARQQFQNRYDEVSNKVIDRVFDALSEKKEILADKIPDIPPQESLEQLKHIVVRHSEELNLMSYVKSERLKNRRIASDLLSFLDTRKPPNLDVYEWDDVVRKGCDLRAVPGMGPLDIDGLDSETQGELLESAGGALTLLTAIGLVLGVGFAVLYFQQTQQEAVMKEIMDAYS
uniref:Uncharacterized protein n=1 Tax=Lotharella oceanica TaxID=641309 RepID=A0A7S2TZ83_9EUKA|mmetsp:Transcript_34877/g.64566  ORF Transcript_34877/g.64566 Transcript_34877/m.64566 type:complete len:231 (+) Transcript_34877:301-993(+)